MQINTTPLKSVELFQFVITPETVSASSIQNMNGFPQEAMEGLLLNLLKNEVTQNTVRKNLHWQRDGIDGEIHPFISTLHEYMIHVVL